MLCEWIINSDQGKCHANYGDCDNDKNAFLERVLKLLDENRESVKSVESITDFYYVKNDTRNN
jgi:hypothetical protein